jgi:hypothetical protein
MRTTGSHPPISKNEVRRTDRGTLPATARRYARPLQVASAAALLAGAILAACATRRAEYEAASASALPDGGSADSSNEAPRSVRSSMGRHR